MSESKKDKADKVDKQAQAWQFWTGTLTSKARAALQQKEAPKLPVETSRKADDEDVDAYGKFRHLLSDAAKEWLDQNVDTEPKGGEDVDTSVARFGLVESPDGEWSVMKLFKTPESLARRLGALEGQDVVVACFFGLPLQVTKGPQRYLILPGGQEAVMIPMYDGGPTKKVAADLLDGLEIQEDGFLGPPELANTKVIEEKLAKAKHGKGGDDDEDEDDEDDEEEAEV